MTQRIQREQRFPTTRAFLQDKVIQFCHAHVTEASLYGRWSISVGSCVRTTNRGFVLCCFCKSVSDTLYNSFDESQSRCSSCKSSIISTTESNKANQTIDRVFLSTLPFDWNAR